MRGRELPERRAPRSWDSGWSYRAEDAELRKKDAELHEAGWALTIVEGYRGATDLAHTCEAYRRDDLHTVRTVPPSMTNSAPWIAAARSEAR